MPRNFALIVDGFGLSDAAEGPQSQINFDEVDISKFLHVQVRTNLPEEITTLQGKFRKVTDGATGKPADDQHLDPGTKIRSGQFEFVVTHFSLEPNATYLIRVADTFTGDTKCLASCFVKTKPE